MNRGICVIALGCWKSYISSKLTNDGREDLRTKLLQLQKIREEERTPKGWNKGLIFPIVNEGSMYECNDYRGKALLPVAYKITNQYPTNV